MRIFVAGATGAVGSPLVTLLVEAGHHVVGSTRSEEGADRLRDAGVVPAVTDLNDLDILPNVVFAARADVVINQLTSLPVAPDDPDFADALRDTAHLRRVIGPALANAAAANGAKRLISQSTAFESAARDDALSRLESATLKTPGLEGVVLRYGYFYGPGTWFDSRPADWDGDTTAPFVHVEDAAAAAALAVSNGAAGIYTIVDEASGDSNAKAREQLGWEPR